MPLQIVVVGSSNTDMVLNVPNLPAPGQTVLGGNFQTFHGGKGANQAVAAARLGTAVTFITAFGDDSFGTEYKQHLCAEGIDTRYVFTKPNAHSGVALILVDSDGENMIAVGSGANSLLDATDLYKAFDAFRTAKIVVLQLEIPMESVESVAKQAKQAGCMVLLNPAPMPPSGLSPELLKTVDIIVPNEGEIMALVPNARTIEEAAENIMEQGTGIVVVTQGRNGATAFTRDNSFHVSAAKVTAVDTVGAGDCFSASLAVSLAEGNDLESAMRFASMSAGLSTTKCGAQEGMPSREAVMAALVSAGS